MALIEIDGILINSMVIFHSYVNVYQRVNLLKTLKKKNMLLRISIQQPGLCTRELPTRDIFPEESMLVGPAILYPGDMGWWWPICSGTCEETHDWSTCWGVAISATRMASRIRQDYGGLVVVTMVEYHHQYWQYHENNQPPESDASKICVALGLTTNNYQRWPDVSDLFNLFYCFATAKLPHVPKHNVCSWGALHCVHIHVYTCVYIL